MKEQPELTIYEVPTVDLVPYANNAKEHTREQVETDGRTCLVRVSSGVAERRYQLGDDGESPGVCAKVRQEGIQCA